jgi:hypothetical protein
MWKGNLNSSVCDVYKRILLFVRMFPDATWFPELRTNSVALEGPLPLPADGLDSTVMFPSVS